MDKDNNLEGVIKTQENIEITVDEPEKSDSSDNNEQQEDKEQQPNGDNEKAESSDNLKLPLRDIRRKSTLVELDSKHEWLAALEEKCLSLETAFISKIQYVAISNHCQEYLEQIAEDETSSQFSAEFSILFDKFQTAFGGSQKLLNKLNETKASKTITDSENRKLKIKMEEQEKKIEDLKYHLENQQNEVLKMEKEIVSLRDLLSEQKSGKYNCSTEQDENKGDKFALGDAEAEATIRKLSEQNRLLEHKLELANRKEIDYKSRLQQVYDENNTLKKELAVKKQQLQEKSSKAKKAELMVANTAVELESKLDIIKDLTSKIKEMEHEFEKSASESSRWRILEKVDPDRNNLLTKLVSLQNQFLKTKMELQAKQVEVKAKEQLVETLQARLKKLADDNDTREELWVCKKELSMRTERVKCLTTENNMFQNLCAKYEKEIMSLRERLRKYKMAEQQDKHITKKMF